MRCKHLFTTPVDPPQSGPSLPRYSFPASIASHVPAVQLHSARDSAPRSLFHTSSSGAHPALTSIPSARRPRGKIRLCSHSTACKRHPRAAPTPLHFRTRCTLCHQVTKANPPHTQVCTRHNSKACFYRSTQLFLLTMTPWGRHQ